MINHGVKSEADMLDEKTRRKNKIKALDRFVSEVKKELNDHIYSIYLFGSMAKGTYTPDSDIDVLVVYSDIEKEKVADIVDEVSFQICCELKEFIEVILMSKHEYDNGMGNSPFLWEVTQFGKCIFSGGTYTKWVLDFQDYLKLSNEYLNYAKDAVKENKIRLAIDAAYNSAELLVKALIISKKKSMVSSHGGIVTQFGELFVVTGEIDSQLGKGLKRGLRLRADARYNPKAELTKKDAEVVIEIAEKLLNIAEGKLDK